MKKRKDGYYKVTKSINGIQKCFYGKTRAEAIRKRDNYIDKKETIVFRDVAEEWFTEHSAELEYNSLKGLKPAYERAVREFGDMFVTDILPSDIAKYIRSFTAKGYADKTTRTQLGVFNMIFKYAINFKGIDMQNPARDVVIPRGLPKRKVSLPSDEDIQKVKDNVGIEFGLFAYFILYTGLRRGELLSLRFEDCRDGFITVDKSIYYDNNVPKIKKPKTASGIRKVPILDKLKPYLCGKGIIFNYKGNYLPQHIFDAKWKQYCKETGIQCSPHQLRHCFTTMLFESGALEIKDIQRILGHNQISTTMDIYTDIRAQREKEIAEKVKTIDIRV